MFEWISPGVATASAVPLAALPETDDGLLGFFKMRQGNPNHLVHGGNKGNPFLGSGTALRGL